MYSSCSANLLQRGWSFRDNPPCAPASLSSESQTGTVLQSLSCANWRSSWAWSSLLMNSPSDCGGSIGLTNPSSGIGAEFLLRGRIRGSMVVVGGVSGGGEVVGSCDLPSPTN